VKPGKVRAAALHHSEHPAARPYPPAAAQALHCPHCCSALTFDDIAFRCVAGHSFDVAKQGYVALLGAGSRTDTGDSAEMVAARVEFLATGHYRGIAAGVAAAIDGLDTDFGPVLEIGAGTGYYLCAALAAVSGTAGIAIDASKFAARRAAAHPLVLSVLADAWSPLPIRTRSIGCVVSVFAPRDPGEISRVLAGGGLFIAVTPTPAHLIELREPLSMLMVDEGKADRLTESFAGLLMPVSRQSVEFVMDLSRSEVAALVAMGPSARHRNPGQLAAGIAELPERTAVTGSVTVSVFQAVR